MKPAKAPAVFLIQKWHYRAQTQESIERRGSPSRSKPAASQGRVVILNLLGGSGAQCARFPPPEKAEVDGLREEWGRPVQLEASVASRDLALVRWEQEVNEGSAPTAPAHQAPSGCEAEPGGTHSVRFVNKRASGLSSFMGHRSKKIGARRHLRDDVVHE